MYKKRFEMFNHWFDVFTRTLPAPIRPASNYILGWSKTAASLLIHRHLYFHRLFVEQDPQKGCIGYIGPGKNLNFIAHRAESSLTDLASEWQTPWWKVNQAVHQARETCDAVVVELPHRFLNRLNLSDGIFTLPFLRWRIKTDCDWQEIESRFHTDARRDLRKSEEINCATTDKQEDLLYFYDKIYYPYITQNFGEMAEPASLNELSYYFKYGWLVLAKDAEDQIVGGSMCFVFNNVMYDYIGATLVGLDRRFQRGVTANYFVHMMRLAHQRGCSALDLGMARPLLDDGVARYKRKWGAYVLTDLALNWGIWIRAGRNPDKTAYFLAQHPWIWIDEAGQLKGFVVASKAGSPLTAVQVRKLGKKFWAPGLHSLIISAQNGFEADVPLIKNPIPELGPATAWTPDD